MKRDYFLPVVGGVVAFAIVVFLFHNFVIIRISSKEAPKTPSTNTAEPALLDTPPAPAITPSIKNEPLPSPPAPTRITDKEKLSNLAIRHSEKGFVPTRIKVSREMPEGSCLIRIINEGALPLIIRLSPHHPKDDWGVLYPPIPSKSSSIIDPRYRIETIAFHNHEKPSEEFKVDLDSQCLP